MRRVCVVITARASYARIKTALKAIRAHPELELQIITAASALLERYGNVAAVMDREGFPSDARVLSVVEGGTGEAMARSTGHLASELAGVLARLEPDVVLTIADRHETLATAVAASYQNIPLVHVQAGETTGSIDDSVRWAVSHLADYRVACSSAAERELLERFERETVWWTGCPSIDIAARASKFRGELPGTGTWVDVSLPFLLVVQHPVTTEVHETEAQIHATIGAVRTSGLPAVWMWPNVDAGTDVVSKALRRWAETEPPVRFIRNLRPEAFVGIAKWASCIVGNSSFGIREAAYLGIPAVNIGTRQQGRERGQNVVDVPHVAESIRREILRLAGTQCPSSQVYGNGDAGRRLADRVAGMFRGEAVA